MWRSEEDWEKEEEELMRMDTEVEGGAREVI